MDERYLMATVRYVELNPVVANFCDTAEDWPWSSAQAHIRQQDDDLVIVKPMLDRVQDWQSYLSQQDGVDTNKIRQSSKTGRPNGNDQFLSLINKMTGIDVRPKRPGRKAKI